MKKKNKAFFSSVFTYQNIFTYDLFPKVSCNTHNNCLEKNKKFIFNIVSIAFKVIQCFHPTIFKKKKGEKYTKSLHKKKNIYKRKTKFIMVIFL